MFVEKIRTVSLAVAAAGTMLYAGQSKNVIMMIPDGNCVIRSGEHVIVFALPHAIEKVERLFTSGR